MRKLITILLLLSVTIKGMGTTFSVGSGSGSISVTSMSGHSYGDTGLIVPGTYSGGITTSNLQGITFINNNGLVTTTQWSLGTDSNMTILGTGLTGTTYGIVLTSGFVSNNGSHMVGTRIWNAKATGGTFINFSGNSIAYDLTNPWTKAARNCTFGNWYSTGTGAVLQGSFGSITALQGVIDSVTFVNLIIDNNQGSGQCITGSGIFRLLVDGGQITGDYPNAFGDAGIVQIEGNCVIRRFKKDGGYGYILRICTAGLDGILVASYVIDCINANSRRYGFVDGRSTTEFGGGTYVGVNNLVGGDLYILNNTHGNCLDTANLYTSVMFIVGNMAPNGVFHTFNNFAYNNVRIQSNAMYQINTADPIDSSHNRYQPTASFSLQDSTTTWMPLANNNQLNGSGLTQTAYTTDYNNVAWTPWGIGAVKFVSQQIINALVFPRATILKQGP